MGKGKKNEIKYSNRLNEIALKGFNKTDLNFFYMIIAKLRDKEAEVITLRFKEIRELTAYTQTSNETFINNLRAMNKKLGNCSWELITEDEISDFHFFPTFTIKPSEQILKVRINPDCSWLLNNLVNEFTLFELETYVSMSGIYPKGLFRLLKQWKQNGVTKKYTADELKELLDTPDYTPKLFMQNVIKPAVEELKQKQAFKNLWVEKVYRAERGKPLDGYIFHFDKTIEGQLTLDNFLNSQTATEPKRKRKTQNKFTDYESKQNYDIDKLEEALIANK